VEVEVAEGYLTRALRAEQGADDVGEQVDSFSLKRLGDAGGLARRLPEAVAELIAREHEAPA
jgi:hypothetical protein